MRRPNSPLKHGKLARAIEKGRVATVERA